ncbi:MAG: HAMP domain-containing sensor histidine kinase [Pseudomonadota bacterium]
MFRNYGSTRLNGYTWSCLVVYTAFASFLSLITGGFTSGAMLLLAHPLALAYLLKQQQFGRASALVGVSAIVLIGLFEIADLTPPELVAIKPLGLWLSLLLTIFLGCAYFYQAEAFGDTGNPDLATQSPSLSAPARRFFDILRDSGDAAFVTVSSLGRIDQFFGARDLLESVRAGEQAEHTLVDNRGRLLQTGLATLPNGSEVSVLRHKDLERGNATILILRLNAEESRLDQGDLQEKLQERTQFFAGFGHDLRSPLNAVIGFADIMANEVRGPIPDGYREYPGLIKESGEALLSLVEDMLAYARSEAGTYQLVTEPTNLRLVADDVMRSLAPAAERAEVELAWDGNADIWADADPMALRRIWDNLISNALKYSSPKSVVRLSASMNGEMAELAVADTGVGMDAAEVARATQPFEQGHNAKGKAGLGLGLALVRRLSELHGGDTRIESAPGQGTTVTVSLRSATAPGATEAAE